MRRCRCSRGPKHTVGAAPRPPSSPRSPGARESRPRFAMAARPVACDYWRTARFPSSRSACYDTACVGLTPSAPRKLGRCMLGDCGTIWLAALPPCGTPSRRAAPWAAEPWAPRRFASFTGHPPAHRPARLAASSPSTCSTARGASSATPRSATLRLPGASTCVGGPSATSAACGRRCSRRTATAPRSCTTLAGSRRTRSQKTAMSTARCGPLSASRAEGRTSRRSWSLSRHLLRPWLSPS
mmetsp:Transcript_84378/g.243936  ORF Transcript_84378/g.243936 Transcript_84378/m.243936 type:complete len:241 (-) Transcript_84378:105-827(-)